MQRLRGGLVSKAHRLVYHSAPRSSVIKKKKKKKKGPFLRKERTGSLVREPPSGSQPHGRLKLSSKVKLHPAINVRALCGANLVTSSSKFGGNETLGVHRVVEQILSGVQTVPASRGYRGYSRTRTRTALRFHGRSMLRSPGPSKKHCVSSVSSNFCSRSLCGWVYNSCTPVIPHS